jgi:ubiquinol-cytochrome c reductase iron-sulfur subunit
MTVVGFLLRVLAVLAGAVLALAALLVRGLVAIARRLLPGPREREVPEQESDARAEWTVIFLLLAATAAAVMSLLVYVLDLGGSTQLLGLTLGTSLALIAAALIVASKRLVPIEHNEEDYSEPAGRSEHREDEEKLLQIAHESGNRVTRRKLIGGAGAAAGTALGAALIAPAASLGPVLDTGPLYESPWRRGRRLVDDRERAYLADEIEMGSFYTAYPEGGDPDKLGSPLIVVRLDPADLKLPRGREGWAPEGILAYSKVCTHAGCAVALYRHPKFRPVEQRPAFVCPCHYSTFDPAAGGTVLFGPAGRNLPQLPLEIDRDGALRAAGDFSGPVGPSFWGVRTRGPS